MIRTTILLCCTLLFAGVEAQIVRVDTLLFKHDRSSLELSALKVLDDIAASYVQMDYRIHIKAYTDSSGDLGYNRALSKRRALSVRNYLIAKSLDSTRITWKEYGELRQISMAGTEDQQAINRRVEIRTVFMKAQEERQEIPAQDLARMTRRSRQGTLVIFDTNTFPGYRLSDLEVDITDAYSGGALIANDWPTVSSNGECLVSGGSARIEVSYQGNEVSPSGTMLILIPSSLFDPEMKVWASGEDVAELGWNDLGTPTLSVINGDTFYVIETSSDLPFNIDKLYNAPPDQYAGWRAMPQQLISKTAHTIRSKSIPIQSAYMVNREGNMMVKGTRMDDYTVRFPACAMQESNKLILITPQGKRNLVCSQRLGRFKHNRILGRVLVKQSEFRSMSDRSTERMLAKL